MTMTLYKTYFNGVILKRGFWLYVWKIVYHNDVFFYVGRTGDSATPYASSPFERMRMHFDRSSRATANCIVRHLNHKKINPDQCLYTLFAYGPIYPEQKNWADHKIYRDKIATLESKLANTIKEELKYNVLGCHPKEKAIDPDEFNIIWQKFLRELKKQ